MRTASFEAADMSNLVGAKNDTNSAKTCTASCLQVAITDLIYRQNPRKTWAFLCDVLGLKERAAKHRLANTSSYTIEELQVLLQSEDGFDFLQALMADAQPKWWWWAKRVIATAERRRQAAEIDQEILQLETSRPPDVNGRRRIKGDLDARTTLGKKFAAAETALGFLAPNADRAVAGTVVPTAAPKAAKRPYAGRGR